jgi:hypothetical protein
MIHLIIKLLKTELRPLRCWFQSSFLFASLEFIPIGTSRKFSAVDCYWNEGKFFNLMFQNAFWGSLS